MEGRKVRVKVPEGGLTDFAILSDSDEDEIHEDNNQENVKKLIDSDDDSEEEVTVPEPPPAPKKKTRKVRVKSDK